MKKLAYIATMVCGLTLAGTSCVDLTKNRNRSSQKKIILKRWM